MSKRAARIVVFFAAVIFVAVLVWICIGPRDPHYGIVPRAITGIAGCALGLFPLLTWVAVANRHTSAGRALLAVEAGTVIGTGLLLGSGNFGLQVFAYVVATGGLAAMLGLGVSLLREGPQ